MITQHEGITRHPTKQFGIDSKYRKYSLMSASLFKEIHFNTLRRFHNYLIENDPLEIDFIIMKRLRLF